jgi:undecaprenyl-diphosphatase
VALGLLHGPTELLPVSSSAHTTLVPWLLGWPYGELDPRLHKSFEVALHAGTAAALLAHRPWADGERPSRGLQERGRAPSGVAAELGLLAAAVIPPSLTGYALGKQIERRFGTPTTIAAGLLAGSAAMSAAEIHARTGTPRVRARGTCLRSAATPLGGGDETRAAADAGARDGLVLGLAQSLALVPGLSRSGATLAAARARGFSRRDSDRLCWRAGMPVIAGAALLKGARLAREGVPSELRLPLATGAAGAFVSTLLSARALSPERRAALLPACVAYRGALALLVIRRMRDNTSQNAPFPKK